MRLPPPEATFQIENHTDSICSTFVICSPRHYTCPACGTGRGAHEHLSSIQRALKTLAPSSSTLNSVITSSATNNNGVVLLESPNYPERNKETDGISFSSDSISEEDTQSDKPEQQSLELPYTEKDIRQLQKELKENAESDSSLKKNGENEKLAADEMSASAEKMKSSLRSSSDRNVSYSLIGSVMLLLLLAAMIGL